MARRVGYRFARLMILILPVVGVCTALPFIIGVPVSYDTRVFLGENNEHLVNLKRFEDTFRRSSQSFLLLTYSRKSVTDTKFAHAIEAITDAAWHLPHVTRVDSLANAPHVVSESGSEFIVKDVLDYVLEHSASNERVDEALSSPQYLGRLVSASGEVAAVVVTLDVPPNTEHDIQLVSESMRKLAAEFEQQLDGLRVRIAGEVPLMEAFGEATKQDMAVLVPTTVLVFVAILMICLRSVALTLVLLFVASASVVGAMACFVVGGSLLNTASSLIPIVTLVVLSANSIHLLFGYQKEHRKGLAPEQAMTNAIALNRVPIVLAAATTIASFLLLNRADAPPFHDLGNYVAIGVTIGTVLLLFWCPIVIPAIERRLRIKRGTKVWLEHATVQGSRINLTAVWFAIIAGVVGLHRLSIDENFVEYFDEGFAIRSSSEFASKHLGGPNYLEVVVTSSSEGGVLEPHYQDGLGRFSEWLRQQNEVASVSSVTDILRSVHQGFDRQREFDELSESELAEYLLAFELSLSSGQSLNDYVDFERRSSVANVLLRDSGSQDVMDLEARVYRWFEAHAPPDLEVLVTGISVPTAHMAIANINAMLISIAGSMVLLATLVGAYFRSLAFSFLALAAIALPMAMGFGYWGWIKGTVGMAASAVAAITVGIVIDDAIHIFARYRIFRREGRGPDAAASSTVREVGPAVATTSLALMLGFSVLHFSGFEINRSLGLCTALIVACALIVDLLALPHALAWLDRRRLGATA